MLPSSTITFRDLTFEWPDGALALRGLSGSFGHGRTGLVGRNGSGKSTLLRLASGELAPTSGELDVSGDVGYLRQSVPLHSGATVAELLGIDSTLRALRAIEAGDVAVEHFDAVGDDWDLESRASEALDDIGFSAADLDRRVGEVSGGEAVLVAIAGLRLSRKAITLLDEPTNNLDRGARSTLTRLVDAWPGTLVIVSHDRALLDRMDATAELYGGGFEVFGGPYSAWVEHRDRENGAAADAARAAQQAVRVEKRQRAHAETTLARRRRAGKKAQREGGVPRIVAGGLARKAENSAASLRSTLDDRVTAATDAATAADARVRDDEHIRLELPDPGVARGRRLAEITGVAGSPGVEQQSVVIQGPERLALVGPNGAGKTTLLEALVGRAEARPDRSERPRARLLTDRVGYLPQRLDDVDDTLSAVDAVRECAPDTSAGDIRNQLARLLLRGHAADRPVSTLSGGERFRVSLARMLFADPPAQLLVLDEPTNSLDLQSVEQLAEALDAYRGAVLVVSHDDDFLARIRIDSVLELDHEGRLHRRHRD
ncbi:ABC-F family ATP-binding cassette domain-containing protein [Marisediminicola sp. LYQ134]|uniref:ABC-F family ATP-binding cassette domain-containing protein n=1 Tax=Marisediminicola sp. LYQ134 TaxID=3391061 RepID=UPI0039834F61